MLVDSRLYFSSFSLSHFDIQTSKYLSALFKALYASNTSILNIVLKTWGESFMFMCNTVSISLFSSKCGG